VDIDGKMAKGKRGLALEKRELNKNGNKKKKKKTKKKKTYHYKGTQQKQPSSILKRGGNRERTTWLNWGRSAKEATANCPKTLDNNKSRGREEDGGKKSYIAKEEGQKKRAIPEKSRQDPIQQMSLKYIRGRKDADGEKLLMIKLVVIHGDGGEYAVPLKLGGKKGDDLGKEGKNLPRETVRLYTCRVTREQGDKAG